MDRPSENTGRECTSTDPYGLLVVNFKDLSREHVSVMFTFAAQELIGFGHPITEAQSSRQRRPRASKLQPRLKRNKLL